MLEFNGKKYARVSEIVTPPGCFDHIDPTVLKKKAQVGTEVHDAIHDELTECFPIVNSRTEKYFTSFLEWLKVISPFQVIESEKRYFCDDKMITGQIDGLITIAGEKLPTLIDFKTSAQASPSWQLQGHLYHYMISKHSEQISPRFLFVKLNPNGGLPTVIEYHFNKNTLNHCFDLVDSYWAKNKS